MLPSIPIKGVASGTPSLILPIYGMFPRAPCLAHMISETPPFCPPRYGVFAGIARLAPPTWAWFLIFLPFPALICSHIWCYLVQNHSLTQAHSPGTWRAINARKHLHTCHSSVILSKTTECIAKLYTHLAVLYLVHMQLLWSKNKKRALSCI